MEEVLDSLNSCKEKVKEVLFEKFDINIDDNRITFPVKLEEGKFFGCLSRLFEDEEFNKIYNIYKNLNLLSS